MNYENYWGGFSTLYYLDDEKVLDRELERIRDQGTYDDNDTPLDSSDDEEIDHNNYKGIFYGTEEEKYTDPVTGAHFEFNDICNRLSEVIQDRNSADDRIKHKLLNKNDIKELFEGYNMYKTTHNLNKYDNKQEKHEESSTKLKHDAKIIDIKDEAASEKLKKTKLIKLDKELYINQDFQKFDFQNQEDQNKVIPQKKSSNQSGVTVIKKKNSNSKDLKSKVDYSKSKINYKGKQNIIAQKHGIYDNMASDEAQLSSKNNSRNMSNRSKAVYVNSGRSHDAKQNLKKHKCSWVNKNSCCLKKNEIDSIIMHRQSKESLNKNFKMFKIEKDKFKSRNNKILNGNQKSRNKESFQVNAAQNDINPFMKKEELYFTTDKSETEKSNNPFKPFSTKSAAFAHFLKKI